LVRGVDLLDSLGGPFLGQVQAGERAAALDRLVVIGPRRLHLVVEIPQPHGDAVVRESRMVLAAAIVTTDALELGGGSAAFGLVVLILRRRADAEIDPTVVGFVAVDVVHDHPLGRLHDLAVHEDHLALLQAGNVSGGIELPTVLIEPFVIGGVDVGMQPAAQRDAPDVAFGCSEPGPIVPAGLPDGRRPHERRRIGMVRAHRPVRPPQGHALHRLAQVPAGVNAVVTTRLRHGFSLPFSLSQAGSDPPARNDCLTQHGQIIKHGKLSVHKKFTHIPNGKRNPLSPKE